ncbi:hypothetical protein KXV78_007695 [Aspergillus fumigatus]|nr:hypothetical protein KXV78_007695 [Aspergillus fumigatus]
MNQYGCYEFYVPWTTNELESDRTSLKRAASSKAAVVSLAKALADELLDYLADATSKAKFSVISKFPDFVFRVKWEDRGQGPKSLFPATAISAVTPDRTVGSMTLPGNSEVSSAKFNTSAL